MIGVDGDIHIVIYVYIYMYLYIYVFIYIMSLQLNPQISINVKEYARVGRTLWLHQVKCSDQNMRKPHTPMRSSNMLGLLGLIEV